MKKAPGKKPNNPHDLFFRAIFHIKLEAIAFIYAFFPKDFLDELDKGFFELDTTSYIDDDLKPFYSDITWQCRLRSKVPLRINILTEHKSNRNPSIFPEAIQIATYKSGIWRLDFKQERRPTFIFPVLLFHGKKKFNKHPFWKLFKKLPESWRKYADDIQFIVIDLNSYTDEELKAKLGDTIICSALLAMKHAHDLKNLKQNLGEILNFGWQKYPQEMAQSFARILSQYLETITKMKMSELTANAENVPSEWNEIYSATIPSVFKEGEEKGIQIGIQKGIRQGIQKGMTLGEENKARAIVKSLIENFPDFSDEGIALVTSVPISLVKKIRQEMSPGKPVKARRNPTARARRKNQNGTPESV